MRPSSPPINALTFDIEDWHELAQRRLYGARVAPRPETIGNTRRILALLRRHDVRATFFLVGSTAAALPDLVREIAAEGHEIGNHGYDHRRIPELSHAQFADDLEACSATLQSLTEQAITGFRAPHLSLQPSDAWAYLALAAAGIRYDSSVLARGTHLPHAVGDSSVTELPIATLQLGPRRVPVGGGFLRFLPPHVIRLALRRINEAGEPATVFLHPHDFAPDTLRIEARGSRPRGQAQLMLWTVRRNFRRGSPVERLLDSLIGEFRFAPASEVVEAWRAV